jgi:molybdenum cofactor cytidylyltransferase
MPTDTVPAATRPGGGQQATVAGLLLAAGAGRRMGRPKALVTIDGEPLAARGVRLLADGGCRPVVVVVGAAAAEVDAALARFAPTVGETDAPSGSAGEPGPATAAVRLVRAEGWAEGIGASLRAGLAALAGLGADAAVVALVDQPALTAAAVRRLVRAAAPGGGNEHHPALTATYRGRPGHPVLVRRTIWDEVAALARGDVGARAWLRAHPAQVGRIACDGLGSPEDVDTPADLVAGRIGRGPRAARGPREARDLREDARMELSVIDNPDRHRYEARTPDGEVAGLVQYQRRPDRIVFVHTEVRPEFEGKGVASALVAGALDDARKQGLAVVPQCPYIRGYIERHPAYADLVADADDPRAG